MIQNVKTILYILTFLGQLSLVVVLVGWIASRLIPATRSRYDTLLQKAFQGREMIYAFLVAAVAMTGSLFFSEVAKYSPCLLCWYQRIAMYPIVLLAGIQAFKKQATIRLHVLALSIVGALIALYHYLLQIGIIPPTSCSEVGASISCSQRFTMGFGYITISMMALTAFVMIASYMGIGIYLEKKKKI